MAAINAMVNVRNNDVTMALKILKRKLKETGTFQKFDEHLAYEKPSNKRKRMKQLAIRRNKYEMKLKKD